MPLSPNIKNYLHIAQVLDAAIGAGGGRYVCESEGQARRWRQMAYYYRRLYEEDKRARLGFPKGTVVETPYDKMLLQIEGRNVIITEHEVKGRLETVEGKAIELAPMRRFADPASAPEPGTVLTEDDEGLVEHVRGLVGGSDDKPERG